MNWILILVKIALKKLCVDTEMKIDLFSRWQKGEDLKKR